MNDDEPILLTLAQIKDAFLTLNFTDPNEWHWKKFIEALLRKERLERKE